MNTINDELVHKVHVLHSILNNTQKIIAILEKENSCLKQKLLNYSLEDKSYKECLESNSRLENSHE